MGVHTLGSSAVQELQLETRRTIPGKLADWPSGFLKRDVVGFLLLSLHVPANFGSPNSTLRKSQFRFWNELRPVLPTPETTSFLG